MARKSALFFLVYRRGSRIHHFVQPISGAANPESGLFEPHPQCGNLAPSGSRMKIRTEKERAGKCAGPASTGSKIYAAALTGSSVGAGRACGMANFGRATASTSSI